MKKILAFLISAGFIERFAPWGKTMNMKRVYGISEDWVKVVRTRNCYEVDFYIWPTPNMGRHIENKTLRTYAEVIKFLKSVF